MRTPYVPDASRPSRPDRDHFLASLDCGTVPSPRCQPAAWPITWAFADQGPTPDTCAMARSPLEVITTARRTGGAATVSAYEPGRPLAKRRKGKNGLPTLVDVRRITRSRRGRNGAPTGVRRLIRKGNSQGPESGARFGGRVDATPPSLRRPEKHTGRRDGAGRVWDAACGRLGLSSTTRSAAHRKRPSDAS